MAGAMAGAYNGFNAIMRPQCTQLCPAPSLSSCHEVIQKVVDTIADTPSSQWPEWNIEQIRALTRSVYRIAL